LKQQRNKVRTSVFEKIFIPANSVRLARSHRIIRIEKEKEILFMKLCSQIHLDVFKKKRSDRFTKILERDQLVKHGRTIPISV